MHLVYLGLLFIICQGITAEYERTGIYHGIGSFHEPPIIYKPSISHETGNIHEDDNFHESGSSNGVNRPYQPSSGGTTGNSCNGDDCETNSVLISGIVFGCIGFVVLLVCVISSAKARKDRPSQFNVPVVRKAINPAFGLKKPDMSIFKSGYWESRYFHNKIEHGPHRLSLWFNPNWMMISGSGTDDVGIFTIGGTYSNETHKIGLKKEYLECIDDRSEYLDRQITIQLTWNAQNNQFQGKWYMQTSECDDENKFELKFKQQHPQIILDV